jgi:hypothetical protein
MVINKNSIYPAKNFDVLVQDQSQSVVPEPPMPFAVNPLRQQIV